MKLTLFRSTLIKRYKRFLADIFLPNGQQDTIHVANTGAMTGCAAPGDTVWFSESNSKTRKYPRSWEITQTAQNHFICVNTIRANQLVEEALMNGVFDEYFTFDTLKREVKYGNENSKADFMLYQGDSAHIIEVKSVTLLEGNQGYFPDAVTLRGQKHLRELADIAKSGDKATLIFAVLHSGIDSVEAAEHIDAKYAQLCVEAQNAGVNFLGIKAQFAQAAESFDISLLNHVPVLQNQ
ncbi:DNA/RNA nuclease SfsA [Thalassotalea agarivorans]|uniref:Sugar fermentation stimulation protein homolog n=1 Tax=Thalassotalea agarivorans TaxID=349064 RepID=A0A1I0GMK6_THASX|nr:DNA/RNA nuclease SfsA [Thalassotalea agarivorans]SET72241.1 sugar fermentation stimulation protein A [Thalassotalea agarivorans]